MYLSLYFLLKIIPPRTFSGGTITLPRNFPLTVVVQSVEKLGLGFNLSYENKMHMTLEEFEAKAKQNEAIFGKTLRIPEEYEDVFWGSLQSPSEPLMYAIDNKGSLFSNDNNVWNLNNFTKKESIIHEQV